MEGEKISTGRGGAGSPAMTTVHCTALRWAAPGGQLERIRFTGFLPLTAGVQRTPNWVHS